MGKRNRRYSWFLKGIVDNANNQAPFQNENGQPIHHIKWLSRGGEDTINNTVALCPNYHKKMHVLNSERDEKALYKSICNV